MTDVPPDNWHLLSACAILRWFDYDLLVALVGYDGNDPASLLTDERVVPAERCVGAYQLRDEVRMDVLTRLRAECPHDELVLHTRAFEYFLSRIECSELSDERIDHEANCLYHLDKLFFLLAPRGEWSTIAQHVAAVRTAHPQQMQHLHQLALYEGHIAINTQDYECAEEILKSLLDRTDLPIEFQMRVWNGLAQVHWYRTHYDRALACYQQAYDRACEADDRYYQGTALLNIGMIYSELDEYDKALQLSRQSLQIFRELRDSYREAYALYEIGNNALWLGRWHVAHEHFYEAIRLCETLGLEARLGNLYWGQGLLFHLLGDATQSEAAYRRALAVTQSLDHSDPTIINDVVWYLGFLYQTQGRWDEAHAMYQQAIALARELHRGHALSLIHYHCGNLFKCQGQLNETMAAYKAALDGVEALRGTIEDEEIKIGLLGTTQQIYEAMVLLCLECDRPADAFNYVERARSRAFLDTLAQKAPELYSTVDQSVATLTEVQAQLPEDALLIEYFTTGVLPRGEHLINRLPPENTRLREHLTVPPKIIIFAVARDCFEVHHAILDPNTLRPLPGDSSPGRRLLRGRLPSLLYQQLIEPVQHLLRGRSLLYLIPHGPLHYVPFMAIRSVTSEYLLEVDGPAIALAPSATILLRNCLDRPPSQAKSFLALGYNDKGSNELCYAEVEAYHVARLMNGQAWTGPAPKSQRLMMVGRQVRWLHIAGHAIYHRHDPLASEVRLGTGDSLSARAIMSGLDLQADLVTLSACTSGLSHVVPGDELLGLQRALLYAGAPTVVCTLWEAADLVALLVMERFYTNLRNGHSVAVALRDAQIAVRDMTGRELAAMIERWEAEDPEYAVAWDEAARHLAAQPESLPFADPCYWAPFMLIGRPY